MSSPPPLRRQLTPVGRTLLTTQTPTNRQNPFSLFILENTIELNDLIHVLDTKVIPSFFRFRSKIIENKYFEEIQDFSAVHITNEIDLTKSTKLHRNNSEYIETLEDYISDNFSNYDIKTSDALPMWRVHLLQFPSHSIVIMHVCHALGDGAVTTAVCSAMFNLPITFYNDNETQLIYDYKKRGITKFGFIMVFLQWIKRWILSLIKLLKIWFDLRSNLNKSIFQSKNLNLKKDWTSLGFFNIKVDAINQRRKELKKQGHACTYNDFMLCSFAQSLSDFIKCKFDGKYKEKGIYIAIPVNLRAFYDNKQLVNGNKVSAYIISLSLDPELSFVQRLKLIHDQVEYSKQIKDFYILASMLRLQGYLPRKLALLLHYINAMRVSAVLTNFAMFHGYNSDQIRLCGSKVTSMGGLATPSPGIALFAAFVSYFGCVDLGLSVDRNLFPNENTARTIRDYFLKVLQRQGCANSDKLPLKYKAKLVNHKL